MKKIGRRAYLKQSLGFLAATVFLDGCSSESRNKERLKDHGLNVYFGDLHNHNSVGYGLGSLERSFDIAHSHLDFYCFTPHAYGDYDVTPTMVKDILADKMNRPYIRMTYERWPDVLALVKSHHKPGTFVTFPGYERHSSAIGDYCSIFPYDDAPLVYFKELKDYQNHIRESGALTWQHHPAYPEASSGAIPRLWDPQVTPLLEIFSEHGNAECDTAPEDYVRHSGRGRMTSQTMQSFLAAGYRFGVVASTDDHLGFPGAYGEGKAAVIAKELTREAIFDALKKRRTYGVSGDKIKVDFRVNDGLMGEELPYTRKREIIAAIQGWDWIDKVEVLKNNLVIHRDFPFDFRISSNLWDKPVLIRMEYGWGGMATNQTPLDRVHPVHDWDMKISFGDSKILEMQPCWQSGPMEEHRRHRISERTEHGFKLHSYTSRRRAFKQRDTNAVVVKLKGSPGDYLTIDLIKPEPTTVKVKLSEVLEGDHNARTKDGSMKIHRIIPEVNTQMTFSINDDGDGHQTDWYYLRILQKNGQLAWSSPIWVEKKS